MSVSPDTPERELRVVSTSTVTLIASTTYDDYAVEEWCKKRGFEFTTDAKEDSDALSEFAGRNCYLSFNADRRRPAPPGLQNSTYLDHIREVGHGSVTEHPSWTFLIDDFSKNCTQELVRHRVGVGYSIQSSRYVDQFSDEYFGDSGHSLGVYIPQQVRECRQLFEKWLAIWKAVVECYNETFDNFRRQGYAKKDARSLARHIIPGGMCNAVVFTVNARELNHIFKMRGDPSADPEIRAMTLRMFDLVGHCNLFNHWKKSECGTYLYNPDVPRNLDEAIAFIEKKYAKELGNDSLIRFPKAPTPTDEGGRPLEDGGVWVDTVLEPIQVDRLWLQAPPADLNFPVADAEWDAKIAADAERNDECPGAI